MIYCIRECEGGSIYKISSNIINQFKFDRLIDLRKLVRTCNNNNNN